MDARYADLIQRHLRVARVSADMVDDPGPSMAVLVDEAERLLARWEAGEPPGVTEPSPESVFERLEEVERRLRARLPRPPAGVWRRWLLRPVVWGPLAGLVVVTAVVLGRGAGGGSRGAKTDLVTGGLRADRVEQGYGVLSVDRRPGGEPVTVEGKPVGAAFLTHANSRIEATVLAPGTHLTGRCGYPDDKRGARMACRISGGGRVLFDSPPIDEARRAAAFDVPVPPDHKVLFEVRSLKPDINFAHVVWADVGVRP
jgi:hypothetical protein